MLAAIVQHSQGATASELGEWIYCKREKHHTRKPQHYARPAARVLIGLMYLGLVCRYKTTRGAATWTLTFAGRRAAKEAKT
jgi:hypothetical protein